jgi:hypothetical protein
MMEYADVYRLIMAVGLAAIGVALLISPQYLFGIEGHFAYGVRELSWIEKKRLQDSILARQQAEGSTSRTYGRYFAVGILAMAVLELVRVVPLIVPFAASSLALALSFFIAYWHFSRTAELRAAPLERRSLLSVLPLTLLVPILCSVAVSVVYATFPSQRLTGTVVAISTLLLGLTAWRIAIAPALLLGADPAFEYTVDERVRRGRAVSIATLACALAGIFSAFVVDVPPISSWPYAEITRWFAQLSWLVALFTGFILLRRPLKFS